MALSNAQRQARHQAKVRDRLALAAVVERFRHTVAAQVSEAGGDPSSPAVVADHLARMMVTSEGVETVRPFIVEAMGLPAWAMGEVIGMA